MEKEIYETWFEVYDSQGVINLDWSIDLINQDLIRRNPDKFDSFLQWLKKTKFAWIVMNGPDIEKRHQLLVYIYYRMRYEDDIWDNDTPNTLDIATKEKIMTRHQHWKFYSWSLSHKFAQKIYSLAHELWISKVVIDGITNIRKSIQRDWRRAMAYEKNINSWISQRDSLVKVHAKDIQQNFYKCDIDWTVFPTARLFWIIWTVRDKRNLIKIWTSSRIIYTIRDILVEPKLWLLHIPVEDLQKYRIEKHHWEKLLEVERFEDLPWNIVERLKDEAWEAFMQYQEYKHAIKKQTFTFESRKGGWKPTNLIQNRCNNQLLKKVILPQGYEKEILHRVEKIEKL